VICGTWRTPDTLGSKLERFVADVEADAALQRAWQEEQLENERKAQG